MKRTVLLLILMALSLSLRVTRLTSVPIFNDEAIHFHWGQILLRRFPDLHNLPLSLDGKQTGVPLLYGAVQRLGFDPLVAGRLINVLASCLTLAVILNLAFLLQPNRRHMLLGLLLALCPFLLFFDRMAMPDSIVTALYTLVIVLFLRFLSKPTFVMSALIGLIIAVGWWLKSTILMVFPTIGIVTAIRIYHQQGLFARMVPQITLMIATFLVLVAPLLFHSSYWNSPIRDTYRIKSFQEILQTPISFYGQQLSAVSQWLIVLLNPLTVIVCIAGLWVLRKTRNASLLFLAILFPLVWEVIFLRTLSARYILFVIPILLYMGYRGSELFGRWRHMYLTLTLGVAVMGSMLLVFHPLVWYQRMLLFPAVTSDFSQYFTGWSSGYGVKEAAEWINEQRPRDQAVVLVRKDSGNPEDGIAVYLAKHPHVIVAPIEAFPSLCRQSADVPYYFVSRGAQYGTLDVQSLWERMKFFKPLDSEFVGVYQLKNVRELCPD